MMAKGQFSSGVEALLQRFRCWLDDPRHASSRAEMERSFDRFAGEFAEYPEVCGELAAVCRLAAALLRGEDVPDSIHVPEGESPADTARWRKWRVS